MMTACLSIVTEHLGDSEGGAPTVGKTLIRPKPCAGAARWGKVNSTVFDVRNVLLGKVIIESLRLAFGIVCVGVTLILGAHWLGLMPDATESSVRARKSLCESIAINAAAHVRKQQWVDLKRTLQTHVDRNPDILSVGIRSELGFLRVDTGHHAKLWPTLNNLNEQVDAVHIPITLNRRPWGKVEICFHRPYTSLVTQVMHHPLVRLLTFFIVCGLGSYTVYVIRILGLFSNTQVVPDQVRQALDTLAEGLLVLDERGRIVLANRAFATLVDRSADDLATESASELSWVAEDISESDYPWNLAIEHSELQAERMLRYQLPDGSQRIFSVNAAPLGKDGLQRGALATFRDVTHVEEHRAELERMLSLLKSSRDEIKRKNKELEILATQDALTGCLNRRAFFEAFETIWGESKTLGTPLACLMFDIDHFKAVNDTYGHHTGDDVLRHVSKVLRELYADSGLICRYGGEEFCVVLPQTDLADAIVAAEETRQAINEIRLLDPANLRLSASIGVSELRFEAETTQDLINQADACLYVAKREGRNRVIAYNLAMANQELTEAELPQERIEIPYQAVTALVTALSYRDANTAEHSRRVADLCARAATGLLDPAQAYMTEVAALLHDIGKIGVPDDILLKDGELTAEEWEVMGRHDRIGKELIDIAFDCPSLSSVASNHHAFYGGSGRNPSLPTGDAIPIGARLLAIADSYDAIISDRCYRKGRSHDEAIAELRRCAGTQFDPRLVEHFAERVRPNVNLITTGAMAIQKQAAMQLGSQVENLAHAVTARDVDRLIHFASELSDIGRDMNFQVDRNGGRKDQNRGNGRSDTMGVSDSRYLRLDGSMSIDPKQLHAVVAGIRS